MTIKLSELISMPFDEAEAYLKNINFTYEVKGETKPKKDGGQILVVAYKLVSYHKVLLTTMEFNTDI